MKITNINRPNIILFGKLNHGDVFKHNGDYFIKIKPVMSYKTEGMVDYNSVMLCNGLPDLFAPTHTVDAVVSAELIIKD